MAVRGVRFLLVGALAATAFGQMPPSVATPVAPAAAAAVDSAGEDAPPVGDPKLSEEAADLGRRVEDVAKRTQSAQLFANPDGTWTFEEASGPVRVQDAKNEWHDLDLSLVERNGVLEPKYSAADVEFSAGGGTEFAQLAKDGHDLTWQWPTELPIPKVDGPTATYADAVDGGDLVVTATTTGFDHWIVLHKRPSSEDLAKTLRFSTPVDADGTTLSETKGGALEWNESPRV